MSREIAFKKFELSRDYFQSPSVQKDVVRCSHEIKDWLMINRSATDRLGNPRANVPWMPLTGFDETTDADRIDLRRAGLRKRIFNHGLRRLLNLLIENGIVTYRKDLYAAIAEVTGFRTMALHEELIGYKISPIAKKRYVNLSDLNERFDMPEDQGAARIRDSIVVPMCEFGLLDVETDDRDWYYIRSGFVAETFHKHIFSPVRAEYEPRLCGEAVQQAEK